MKPNIIHKIAVCLAAFALPFIAACSQEESLQEGDSSIQAVFTIDLGDAAKGKTRATPTDGEYSKGSGLENVINLPNRDFRCYLFKLDNGAVSELKVVSILDLKDGKYSVRLRLENSDEVKSALTKGCRFVFLANWDTYPELTTGMTIEELCRTSEAEFGFSQDKTQLSEKYLIPMYGVKEFDKGVQDFKDGKIISDIGTIHLLRAYAKIDVNITFEDFEDETKVESLSLTHSSNKGFKAPANVTKQSEYITGSWLTDYTPVNIPADADDIDLTLTKDETSGHYIAYVPEYRNVDEQKNPLASRSRIKVCFVVGDVNTGGRKVEAFVDFNYPDTPLTGIQPGQHFDIARNNWYKFNINITGKDIEWTVDVIPFTAVVLDPDMGLEREEFTGYIVGKDAKGRLCWYDGNYYDPDKAVPLYLGPKGHEGESVTINGIEYLLVYADYERTVANLDHFFEKKTRKKYLLTPEGITGYKNVNWAFYLNKQKQRVWLEDKLRVDYCRTLNEWERQEYSIVAYNWAGYEHDKYNPRYWFDILGNRYPWSEGDTKEKRKKVLGEWVNYLQDSQEKPGQP